MFDLSRTPAKFPRRVLNGCDIVAPIKSVHGQTDRRLGKVLKTPSVLVPAVKCVPRNPFCHNDTHTDTNTHTHTHKERKPPVAEDWWYNKHKAAQFYNKNTSNIVSSYVYVMKWEQTLSVSPSNLRFRSGRSSCFWWVYIRQVIII